MNQTSREGQGNEDEEGSTGCAGSGEQLIQPKSRLRSVLSMCPVTLRTGRKSCKVSLGKCSSPVKDFFCPGWGWQSVGLQQGRGEELLVEGTCQESASWHGREVNGPFS